MENNMKVVKNDTVLVISGNYRGKKGKVLKVFPKENRVIVEGVNFIKRHTKPSQKNQQGGIVHNEFMHLLVAGDEFNLAGRQLVVVRPEYRVAEEMEGTVFFYIDE